MQNDDDRPACSGFFCCPFSVAAVPYYSFLPPKHVILIKNDGNFFIFQHFYLASLYLMPMQQHHLYHDKDFGMNKEARLVHSILGPINSVSQWLVFHQNPCSRHICCSTWLLQARYKELLLGYCALKNCYKIVIDCIDSFIHLQFSCLLVYLNLSYVFNHSFTNSAKYSIKINVIALVIFWLQKSAYFLQALQSTPVSF